MLPCDHPCCGAKDEINCPPCIEEACAEKHPELNQNGDDYCNICFVEGLKNAPCIRASCGHYFHYHCMKTKIETK